MSEELMTIREAAMKGIKVLTNPTWEHPMEQLHLSLTEKTLTRPVYFYSPKNGVDDPVTFDLLFMRAFLENHKIWLKYEGPLNNSEAYILERRRLLGENISG